MGVPQFSRIPIDALSTNGEEGAMLKNSADTRLNRLFASLTKHKRVEETVTTTARIFAQLGISGAKINPL